MEKKSELIPKPYEVLLSKYARYGNLNNFFDVVMSTGYPYFEWNDRIYKVTRDGWGFKDFVDTGLKWE